MGTGERTVEIAVPVGLLDLGDAQQMLTKTENADLNSAIGEEPRPSGLNLEVRVASELFDRVSFNRQNFRNPKSCKKTYLGLNCRKAAKDFGASFNREG